MGKIVFLLLMVITDLDYISSIPATDSSSVNFYDEDISASISEIPPCPDGQDFCESPEDYPLEISSRAALFTNPSVFSSPGEVGLQTRIGGLTQESRACDSRKSTIFPRKARDLSGTFKYILNSDKYSQSLEIEQCIGEGLKCRVDSDAPSPDSTFCRQKYAKYQFIALDKDGNEILEFFKLPAACLCYHTREESGGFGILRFGAPVTTTLPICPKKAQPLTSRFSNDKPVEVNTDIQFPNSGENTGGPARRYGRQQRDIQFPDSMETWESIQQRKLSGHLLAYFNSQNRNYRQASSEELSADSYEELSAESSEEILFSANTENLEARGCGDKSYCEDSTFYPESYVVNLLETNSKIPPGIVNKFVKQACVDQADLIQIRQFNLNEEQLCQAPNRIIAPKQAQNLNNEWRFIVNIRNLTQTVEIEECMSENVVSGGTTASVTQKDFGSCRYSGILGNNPSKTSCKQLYREHKLLAVTNSGLEIDSFRFPSACSCFIREEFNFEFRKTT
ncbi:uncharacterized protein LOC111707685 isoform X2 [Eurytemora carolleeae]|uniref:uncharacterized protein LOC111707685 isoform X2 n=1 Tax=Eurytemora carolleeae TaxID=1294199 RepID=UPI000C758F6B|nr:uncharacterized protein LOC111707685 isoform X2 [Eurytemora carolleeae]|eukprot:XP_023336592.1 uncharacterized protein LOC111707685 isoform X2 [Eurytemora affinis]